MSFEMRDNAPSFRDFDATGLKDNCYFGLEALLEICSQSMTMNEFLVGLSHKMETNILITPLRALL